MSPDERQDAFDTPAPDAGAGRCTDCGSDLGRHQYRCGLCQLASRVAIVESNGQIVRPSDVARTRDRLQPEGGRRGA